MSLHRLHPTTTLGYYRVLVVHKYHNISDVLDRVTLHRKAQKAKDPAVGPGFVVLADLELM